MFVSSCLAWGMLNEVSLGILEASLRGVINPIVQKGKQSLRCQGLKVTKLSRGRDWGRNLGFLASNPCTSLCTSQATAGA